MDKIITNKSVLSLGRPTPVVNNEENIFMTLSLSNKERYEKEQWQYIDVDKQITILEDLIRKSFKEIRKLYNIPEFTVYFELNKSHNIHIHGTYMIESTLLQYDLNLANMAKKIMKICKCNSYGIKLEYIKNYNNTYEYCTKGYIDYTNI